MSRVLACLFLVLVAGCTGSTGSDRDAEPGTSSTPSPSAAPKVGGATTDAQHPAGRMTDMERYIAAKLAPAVTDEKLSLEYLDCPAVGRPLPRSIVCDGYFNGVVGDVEVLLDARTRGVIDYDATLTGGVISTAKLVERIEDSGYRRVECGPAPAYPAKVGSEVVCSAVKDGDRAFLVATVSDHAGGVMIEEY